MTSVESVSTVLKQTKPTVIIQMASPMAAETTPNEVYAKVSIDGARTLLKCAGDFVKALFYTSSTPILHYTINDLRGLRVPAMAEMKT